MTALQTRLRNQVDECHASMGQLWVAKLFTEAANRIDALESAIEEQTRTIGALNMCIGGPGSASLENITRIGELEAIVAQRNAMLSRGHADFMQALTDPENQPSQFGTVTLEMYQELEAQVNQCGSGAGCLHKEATIDSLREQVSVLSKALNGFIANSCRVDWPADIYDAAIAAQKGTV